MSTLLNTDNIIINKNDKIETVIKTICRIISERKYSNKSVKELFDKLKSLINDDQMLFTIDDKKFGIKFIPNFLTTIKKETSIENFLDKNSEVHKFVIISRLSDRAIKQILEYKNTEVFTIDELLVVVIDHYLVPQHILLSPE